MSDVADIEVVCPGMLAGVLEVLSIGKGDLRLTVGGDNPQEVAKARTIITEMLRAGYAIFVETDKGLSHVKRFNPKRMTYIITEVVEDAIAPTKRGHAKDKEVPVGGSKATAVGRTSGG